MLVLALKLTLAPAFVVGASLTARRLGPRIGGLVGGLPVVGGPILLVLAVVHDGPFAGRAATAALLGLISLAAFVVAYALASPRGWPAALLVAWLAFALCTVAFALLTAAVHVPPTLGLLAACASFAAAARWFPASAAASITPPPRPPAWDLPVRALCAAAMVLAITALASAAGSRVAGLLAPAPIITSILAAFTHAQAGTPTALRILRGMLTGFYVFAAFCWAVAIAL